MKHASVLGPMTVVASLFALGACSASEGGGGGAGGADGGGAGGTAATGGMGGSTGGTGGTTGGTGGATGGTGGATGGTGGTTGGTGGTDGGAGDAGGDAGPTATVSGSIVGLITSTTPVSGMKVCVYQTPSIPCVTTGSTGNYQLMGVPANANVLLEYTKTGYLSSLVTVKTVLGPMSIGQFQAPTTSEADTFASMVGTTIDPTKGQILITAFQGAPGSYTGQDNVTATLTPKSGTGPFYLTSGMLPSTSLTTTSTAGIGLFANVSPGDAEVTLTHLSKSCQRMGTSWAGSTPTASKVKVVAGYLTAGAGLECP